MVVLYREFIGGATEANVWLFFKVKHIRDLCLFVGSAQANARTNREV